MDSLPRYDEALLPRPAAVPASAEADPVLLAPVPPPRPRRKGWPLVAWVVILALVGYLVVMNMKKTAGGAAGEGAAWLVTVESQGRYLVGAASIGDKLSQSNPAAGASMNKQQMLAAAKQMDRDSYSQRLRYAILAGELGGPGEGRLALAALEHDRDLGKLRAGDASVNAARLLDRLYEGYEESSDAPEVSLDEQERQTLRDGLRWYGDLALAPEGGDQQARDAALAPAVRTAVTYLILGAAVLFGLAAGVLIVVFVIALAAMGKLQPALRTGSGHGGVYAETFALYMLIYFGLGYALIKLGPRLDFGSSRYLVALGVMLGSLAALAWPVLRGIPWRRVREEIGLTFDRRPIVNILLGPVTYLGALPLLGLGIVALYLLMKALKIDATQPGAGPSHPIVNVAFQRDWWVWLQVFLVAAVGAPVVEEIMFRGVLYRHLREASRWLRVSASVLLSVLVSGFVFAVIHPQGWLGVPVLMALATAFALAREWQRSLVPAMIAHGINNGVALLVLLLVAS